MKREMIEIGTTIRVENGPARKTDVATKALLDNKVTAEHYQEGLPDAMGKKIVLGDPMTYLHFRGEMVWYVYQLEEVPIDDETIGKITAARVPEGEELTTEVLAEWFGVVPEHILSEPWRVMRFMPRGEPCATKEEALAVAGALAAAEGKEDAK